MTFWISDNGITPYKWFVWSLQAEEANEMVYPLSLQKEQAQPTTSLQPIKNNFEFYTYWTTTIIFAVVLVYLLILC